MYRWATIGAQSVEMDRVSGLWCTRTHHTPDWGQLLLQMQHCDSFLYCRLQNNWHKWLLRHPFLGLLRDFCWTCLTSNLKKISSLRFYVLIKLAVWKVLQKSRKVPKTDMAKVICANCSAIRSMELSDRELICNWLLGWTLLTLCCLALLILICILVNTAE